MTCGQVRFESTSRTCPKKEAAVSDSKGQAAVEYALLVVGVGLGIAILLTALGSGLIARAQSIVDGWI